MKISSKTWGLLTSAPVVLPITILIVYVLWNITIEADHYLSLYRLCIDALLAINPVLMLVSLSLLWQQNGGVLVTFCFGISLIWLIVCLLLWGMILAFHLGWLDFHPVPE